MVAMDHEELAGSPIVVIVGIGESIDGEVGGHARLGYGGIDANFLVEENK
jgi:hypothetical protein